MAKKFLSLAMALALCLGLCFPALAAEDVHIETEKLDLTITNVAGSESRTVQLEGTDGAESRTITVYYVSNDGFSISIHSVDGVTRGYEDPDVYGIAGLTVYLLEDNVYCINEASVLDWDNEMPGEGSSGNFLYAINDQVYYMYESAMSTHVEPAADPDASAEPSAPIANPDFSDVSSDSWYAGPVDWAVAQGITTGTTATTFSPDDDCTHAQILTFLWRSQGQPEPSGTANSHFEMSPDDYYYKAVLWAGEKGLFGHVFNTDLNKGCSREDTVLYLWSLADHPSGPSIDFSDVMAGSASYMAVSWAVDQGITTGTSATAFSPDSVCTRAEIVTFLYRAFADE